jgi:large subunit ribosomal protein L21
MAYAIIKTGGKQYRVEQGQTLLVERLPEEAGATVVLKPLLFRSSDTVFDADGLAGVSVTARILAHERGEKLRVFKFKPKRGYKRTAGHRQELTRLEITSLTAESSSGSARATSPERGAPLPAEEAGNGS